MAKQVHENTTYRIRIKDWPVHERPRERLIQLGPGSLSDAELLALLIGSGTGGASAVDLAKILLTEIGSFSVLCNKTVLELSRIKGIGRARAARIVAAFEVGRRTIERPRERKEKIRTPEDIVTFFSPCLRDARHEIFKVILLDGANRIIRDYTVSEGTLNASVVHPREVFKPAVDELASAVILVHNHPSGNIAPSPEDRAVTQQMVEAGRCMGIPVLDHIIIAGKDYYSFAREGLIREWEKEKLE